LAGSRRSSNEFGYPHILVGNKLVLCAEAGQMFMRTVQQNVFLILNSVPATFVTDPELQKPSVPVMMHSFD
jgi:hypothetical protein